MHVNGIVEVFEVGNEVVWNDRAMGSFLPQYYHDRPGPYRITAKTPEGCRLEGVEGVIPCHLLTRAAQ